MERIYTFQSDDNNQKVVIYECCKLVNGNKKEIHEIVMKLGNDESLDRVPQAIPCPDHRGRTGIRVVGQK